MPDISPRGTFVKVAESLRRRIGEGEITTALPSEAMLVVEFAVSRGTVGRALRSLREEGLIEAVQGGGWFVAGTGDRRPVEVRLGEILAELSEGETVPSEAELGARFGVSRTAIRRALAQVEGAGLVHTIKGRGRFVTGSTRDGR